MAKKTANTEFTPKVKGLRLKLNQDGTYTDQYGRVLARYTNKQGEQDLRPIGLDPNGARH